MTSGARRSRSRPYFCTDRYYDLVKSTGIVPAVNQRETHPLNQQKEMVELGTANGTVVQTWAPLAQGNPDAAASPVLQVIAENHGKSVAQVMLHWLIQRGIPLVAKSNHSEMTTIATFGRPVERTGYPA